MELKNLSIALINTDGGTQMRTDLRDDVVAEYAATIREGSDFPPVVVFHDGSKFWLADGFHRFHAYRAAGAIEIPAEVRQGTKRDAVLFSVGANASHGLRRTNEDKRKAVLTLLNDKEWKSWPQAKIAQYCGVSREYVSRVSGTLSCDRSQDDKRTVERGGTTYEQNTAKIGKPEKQLHVDGVAHVSADESAPPQIDSNENLPPFVVERERAKAEAIAARSKEHSASPIADLALEDRVAELEEEVRTLEAENSRLAAENKIYFEMKAEFVRGGYAAVIARHEEVNRVLKRQVEKESADKASWARSSKLWKDRALEAGWSNEEVIDLREDANGSAL